MYPLTKIRQKKKIIPGSLVTFFTKVSLHLSIIFLIIFSSNAKSADCGNLLKLEIVKRLHNRPYIFSQDFQNLIDLKKGNLSKDLSLLPNGKMMILKKGNNDSLHFKKMLASGKLSLEIEQILIALNSNIHNKGSLKWWIIDLYKDIVVQLYIDGSILDLKYFERTHKLPEKYILKVLLDRSKAGGFSGELSSIERIRTEIEEKEFQKLLVGKKYIYDINFQDHPHGHLIHFFQIDFIIHSLINFGINPSKAAEIYTWFGENQAMKDISGNYYPIKSWGALYDSLENDLTSPEQLGPILKGYFQWEY